MLRSLTRHLASPGRLLLAYVVVGSLVAAPFVLLGLAATDDPDAILHRAVDAARDDDREAYLACFTERSRPVLETFWAAADLGNPPLAQLAAGDVQVLGGTMLTSRDLGPDRMVLVVTEGEARMRVVMHGEGGSWRIDLLDTERYDMGVSDF